LTSNATPSKPIAKKIIWTIEASIIKIQSRIKGVNKKYTIAQIAIAVNSFLLKIVSYSKRRLITPSKARSLFLMFLLHKSWLKILIVPLLILLGGGRLLIA
jgi:hypothetical protein